MNSAGGLMAIVTAIAAPAPDSSRGGVAARGVSDTGLVRTAGAKPVPDGLPEFAGALLESVAPGTISGAQSSAAANPAAADKSLPSHTGQTSQGSQARQTREDGTPSNTADLLAPERAGGSGIYVPPSSIPISAPAGPPAPAQGSTRDIADAAYAGSPARSRTSEPVRAAAGLPGVRKPERESQSESVPLLGGTKPSLDREVGETSQKAPETEANPPVASSETLEPNPAAATNHAQAALSAHRPDEKGEKDGGDGGDGKDETDVKEAKTEKQQARPVDAIGPWAMTIPVAPPVPPLVAPVEIAPQPGGPMFLAAREAAFAKSLDPSSARQVSPASGEAGRVSAATVDPMKEEPGLREERRQFGADPVLPGIAAEGKALLEKTTAVENGRDNGNPDNGHADNGHPENGNLESQHSGEAAPGSASDARGAAEMAPPPPLVDGSPASLPANRAEAAWRAVSARDGRDGREGRDGGDGKAVDSLRPVSSVEGSSGVGMAGASPGPHPAGPARMEIPAEADPRESWGHAAPGEDVLARMDSGSSASSPRLLEPSVAIGIDDPAHGWIEVRAQGGAGQVTASLSANSPEAHAALHAQLPALAQYLEERDLGVRSLAVSGASGHAGEGFTPGGSGAGSGGQGGAESSPGSAGNPRGGPGAAEERPGGKYVDGRNAAHTGVAAASGEYPAGSGRLINVRA
jgi:hypothetical protein